MRAKNGIGDDVLQPLYTKIYDEYFLKTDNKKANRFLELQNLLNFLPYKRKSIQNVLQLLWETPSNLWHEPNIITIRHELIGKINEMLDEPIDIDADFTDEVSRVLNVELGILENEISEAEMEIEILRKEASKSVFDFYETLGNISDAHGRTLDERILLPMFVAEEKRAIKKAEAQKNKK